ncbi:MAG: nucleotidyltransferase domain-containing protein [Deltaproteobacteria bacterium]
MTAPPKTQPQIIPGIPNQYGHQILDIFQPLRKGTSLILFGSRAKRNYREGSDIDIAVKGNNITPKDRDIWLLKYEALNLPWKLDLIIYNHIKETALIAHINRVGIRIL